MKAQKDPLIVLPAHDFEGTMKAIQATIYQYAHQTKSDFFEFNDYRENDLFEDYKWLWQWTRQQIKYRLDAPLKEEIRTPSRTWYDRKKGVDCEDYVIFVSTILLNNRIPHVLRVADYGSGWQHIYVVVPGAKGKEIIIDPVKDRFNTEQPFINKKDYKIRLNGKGLSGIDSQSQPAAIKNVYLDEKEYSTIKAVESFPNPNVKIGIYKGQKCRIIKTGEITFELIKNEEKSEWYKIPLGGYIAKNSTGFFPKELVAGIIGGKYSEKTELSKKTGFVNTANLGTASVGITNLKKTIDILKANNFKVITPANDTERELAIKIAAAKAKIKIALLQ